MSHPYFNIPFFLSQYLHNKKGLRIFSSLKIYNVRNFALFINVGASTRKIIIRLYKTERISSSRHSERVKRVEESRQAQDDKKQDQAKTTTKSRGFNAISHYSGKPQICSQRPKLCVAPIWLKLRQAFHVDA